MHLIQPKASCSFQTIGNKIDDNYPIPTNCKTKSSKQNKKEKSSKNTKETRKLKILCIHGYRQNEKMFREKTGAFRKIVGKHADLVFITAPHAVQPMNEEDSNQVTYNQPFFRYSLIFRMCF